MRTIPYQYGERVAAADSFGRVARSAPVSVLNPAPVGGIDAGMVRLAPSAAVRSSFELHAAARSERSRQVGELIVRALRWLNGNLERYLERRRQRALERATFRALMALDNRTLRDLGMVRSELMSIAREIGRDSELGPLRAARVANGLRLF
jgi:hypothetical protein